MLKILLVAFCLTVVSAKIYSIYDAVVKDLDGNDVSFKKYKGSCILNVVTTSGHYEERKVSSK